MIELLNQAETSNLWSCSIDSYYRRPTHEGLYAGHYRFNCPSFFRVSYFERKLPSLGIDIDCTVKFMRILVASDLWRTFAASHDVSYIYMRQRDLQGFASDPELKNSSNCVYERVT